MIAHFGALKISFNNDNRFIEICPIILELFNSLSFVAHGLSKKN
jgi:hypothetical protein